MRVFDRLSIAYKIIIQGLILLSLSLLSTSSLWAQELLPVNQAFQFSVKNSNNNQAILEWKIADNYYLYQQKFSVKQGQQAVSLNFPAADTVDDENFGRSQVYWKQLSLNIPIEANQHYQVMWQGCAKDQLCYAPQKTEFKTDAQGKIQQTGLFKSSNTAKGNVFLKGQATNSQEQVEKPKVEEKKEVITVESTPLAKTKVNTLEEQANSPTAASEKKEEQLQETQVSADEKILDSKDQVLGEPQDNGMPQNDTQTTQAVSPITTNSISNNIEKETSSGTLSLTNDTHWSEKLRESSLLYSVIIFLGLGVLLAFTPCSLPMIPILSSLIVRQKQGVKAWIIAFSFVLSMAMVYAVMGFIASYLGLSLQRWLQQPMVVIGFSLLFIVFALNLFGLFELQLPNKIMQRLNHLQNLQKGGSIFSAIVMGGLSALLVGPCMTAPLAGVLLYITQTDHQWQGAVLLFCLGFGMGIPLLLVSILGSKALPKVGEWMNQVKVLFAFIMLGLSIYFIRPLLPEWVSFILNGLLVVGAVSYVLYKILHKYQKKALVYSVLFAVLAGSGLGVYSFNKMSTETETAVSKQEWIKVRNAEELNQALQQNQGKQVLIDIYADWCVSCQPIERFLAKSDTQQAIQDYVRIKLDLSEYDERHQALLNELQVLGPPTMLFLTAQHQELRALRLTGSFNQQEFLEKVQQLSQSIK